MRMRRAGHTIAAIMVGGCISVTVAARPASRSRASRPVPATQTARQSRTRLSFDEPAPQAQRSDAAAAPTPRAIVDKYCITCHNQRLHTAGLELDSLDLTTPGANTETWEKVIARLRAGSMPPPGVARPDKATYRAVASRMEDGIDRAWEANPHPGRIGAVHRLNRAEYNHAIRDLFAVDLDVRPLLPGDETADGSFDNFADVLSISTAHLERYMSVARQVTRAA